MEINSFNRETCSESVSAFIISKSIKPLEALPRRPCHHANPATLP